MITLISLTLSGLNTSDIAYRQTHSMESCW